VWKQPSVKDLFSNFPKHMEQFGSGEPGAAVLFSSDTVSVDGPAADEPDSASSFFGEDGLARAVARSGSRFLGQFLDAFMFSEKECRPNLLTPT
jgi:hypothetical protein